MDHKLFSREENEAFLSTREKKNQEWDVTERGWQNYHHISHFFLSFSNEKALQMGRQQTKATPITFFLLCLSISLESPETCLGKPSHLRPLRHPFLNSRFGFCPGQTCGGGQNGHSEKCRRLRMPKVLWASFARTLLLRAQCRTTVSVG